jgi:single-strand DNA-binding protein
VLGQSTREQKGQDMASHLNHLTLSGNLTRDPVLVPLPTGQSACELRVACNRMWHHKLTGRWVEWVDYFDVRVFGSLAPAAHRHLHKGSGLAIDGRLSHQPSRCNDPGHRQDIVILADQIQFSPIAASSHPVPVHPDEMLIASGEEPAPVYLDETLVAGEHGPDGLEESPGIEASPASNQPTVALEH